MKNSTLNLGLLLLVFLTISSCSKDDDKSDPTPTTPETVNGAMNAQVGENTFSAEDVFARYRTTGELTLTATTDDGEKLFFVINDFAGELNYSFGSSLLNKVRYSYQFNNNEQVFTTNDGGSGTLSVTDYNESENTISGDFTLTVVQASNPSNSLQISEGSFTNIQINSMEAPAPGTIAYYADDVYYDSESPELEVISFPESIKFTLPAPNGDREINLQYEGIPEDEPPFVIIFSGLEFSVVHEISEYSLIDDKLTLKLKSEETWDFELWINEYPLE